MVTVQCVVDVHCVVSVHCVVNVRRLVSGRNTLGKDGDCRFEEQAFGPILAMCNKRKASAPSDLT
jgi:hypothetical protein